jgi:hypothetical protein
MFISCFRAFSWLIQFEMSSLAPDSSADFNRYCADQDMCRSSGFVRPQNTELLHARA